VRRCLVLMFVLLAALLVMPRVAAAEVPVRSVDYVALGDSYPAGVGTRLYVPSSQGCRRSPLAYPVLWRAKHRAETFTFAACSGATTRDVLESQLASVAEGTDVVTLTVGGNDVGFSAVVSQCTLGESTCRSAIAVALERVSALPTVIGNVLDAVHARAPQAQVFLLGYPKLFGSGPCTAAGLPPQASPVLLDDGATALNEALATAARAHRAEFVDVSARFLRHGTCAPAGSRWINPPTSPTGESYHPNIRGHALGYIPALDSASRFALLAAGTDLPN
jgi:lysophospholipase L1-like esterase